MGIPISAIPGKRWVDSGKLIVAIGDSLTQAFVYCDRFPKWTSVELHLKVEERLPTMIVGNDVAAVWLRNVCLSYSSHNGNWDILTLAENESALPTMHHSAGESLVVHSPSRGDFVFKNEWGKWFSADEIKQGKVAEFLMQQRRQSSDFQVIHLNKLDTQNQFHSLPANRN